MTITYTQAIDTAIAALNSETQRTTIEKLQMLRAMIEKRNASHGSDAAKAKANEKRKAETAAKRAEFLAQMVPIVREGMDTTPRTDKEIYNAITCAIPAELTLDRVRYMLVHNEVGADIVTVKNGRNPNTYYIKERA